MKRTVSSLLSAVCLLSGISVASAANVITSFDEAALDAVLAEVGATTIEKITVNGDPARNFTLDQINYTTALRGCQNGANCAALMVQCVFTGETFSTATSNAFNLKQTYAVTAVAEDRKALMLGRLVLARGGTTLGNAVENFKAFFTLPPLLREQAIKDAQAPVASVQPGVTPAATSGTPVAVATAPGAGASADAGVAAPIWVVDGVRANPMR